MDQLGIRCVFMRGGTSRGCFLWESDLPKDAEERDRVLLAIYGSPDARQINGMGGGDPLTSKAIIMAPSSRPDVDVEYTFAQVGITEERVFYGGNCGNMLSGVGPFAVDEGWLPAQEPVTLVRILNRNTNQIIHAEVPVADGRSRVIGDTAISGVPGMGAEIKLNFLACEGALSGRLLPTGHPVDTAPVNGQAVPVSLVDAATPFVFVRAADIGAEGTELPHELEGRRDVMDRLEQVRTWAAQALGVVASGEVAREVSPNVPRVAMVASPSDYVSSNGNPISNADISLVARQLSMQRPHKTYAVTGSICTAVAAQVPGTVVAAVTRAVAPGRIAIGHPMGSLTAEAAVVQEQGEWRVTRAALVRTARRLMDGTVYVPKNVLN